MEHLPGFVVVWLALLWLVLVAVGAATLWRGIRPRLRCNQPLGIDRSIHPRGRLVKCDLPWRHRGRHRLPRGAPLFAGMHVGREARPWVVPPSMATGPRGSFSMPTRCDRGYVHADQADAIACALGAYDHEPAGVR